MASITKRTDKNGRRKYDVRIRIRGHAIQTGTFDRLTDAKQWVHFVESEIRMGKRLPTKEARKRTLAEAIDRYIDTTLQEKPKSIAKQKVQLLWWKRRLGHKFLIDITSPLLCEERDKMLREFTRRGTKRSPSTVVRYMAILSHLFTIAMKEWDWVDDNPFRKVKKPKEPKGRMRFLAEGELHALLHACRKDSNPILYPVVLLALSTGMRQSEILCLSWEDVNFERKMILLQDTKNGDRRAVPLIGEAYVEMQKLKASRSQCTNFIFPAIRPTRLEGIPNRYNPQYIHKAWYRALAASGIKDFRFHDLRHTAASYMGMSGATHNEIAALLGHKTLHMVHRYTHFGNDHILEMTQRMNEKYLSSSKIHAFTSNE